MICQLMWNRRTDQLPLVERGGLLLVSMGGVFKCVLYLEPVVDDTPVDGEQEGRSVATRRKGRRAAGMCVLV